MINNPPPIKEPLPTVLVVEDQKSMALFIKQKLQNANFECEIINAFSKTEAEAILESHSKIDVCLSDLNLPDAANGEMVDVLNKHNITTVVFTSSYSETTRDQMYRKHVADYVIKDGEASIDYAISSVQKLLSNHQQTIWIVASIHSKTLRRLFGLLTIHRYDLKTFASYQDLLFALERKRPNIVLIENARSIEDMDVYKVISKIRGQYNPAELPIISSECTENLSTAIKMMKYGVNDFFNSGFSAEELYIRVRQTIDQSHAFQEIQWISQRDALTGLFNRRHFFETSEPMLDNASGQSNTPFVIMLDIDHFKKVNDTYGHQKGDEAIIYTANLIKQCFSDYVFARFGGEEYCVFGESNSEQAIFDLCENFRKTLEAESKNETEVAFTACLGISFVGTTMDEMIAHADEALYQSKNNGRNKTTLFTPP